MTSFEAEPGHGSGPDVVYPIDALTESHPK